MRPSLGWWRSRNSRAGPTQRTPKDSPPHSIVHDGPTACPASLPASRRFIAKLRPQHAQRTEFTADPTPPARSGNSGGDLAPAAPASRQHRRCRCAAGSGPAAPTTAGRLWHQGAGNAGVNDGQLETWLEQWREGARRVPPCGPVDPRGAGPARLRRTGGRCCSREPFRLAHCGFKGSGLALSGLREELVQPRGISARPDRPQPWCRPRA